MSESVLHQIDDYSNHDGFIWLDGKMVPWREARIHVLSHVVHYASSVFEGLRAYDGKPFELHRHSLRHFDSADALDLPLSDGARSLVALTPEQLNDVCLEVMDANSLKDAYIRPLTWRGPEEMGVSARGAKVHTMVAAWYWGDYFSEGLRLARARYRRAHPNSVPWRAKTAGLYAICTLSKHAAAAAGYGDALMLDHAGDIAEATGANIFFVRGAELHTPIPDSFLDGITRQTIIELAKRRGYSLVERKISPSELGDFEDCFLTGTAAEVSLVSAIQRVEGGNDDVTYRASEVSQTLRRDYAELVRSK